VSVTEQLLSKREEYSRCKQQPPEMLSRRVLTGGSMGRPELALLQDVSEVSCRVSARYDNAVRQNTETKLNSFWDVQPVTVTEKWSHVR